MRVAIAIIVDDEQRILITRRPLYAPYGGGLWEFPGGKLEQDEAPQVALVREVYEEVGLVVHECDFLGEIRHAYAHYSVALLVYCVRAFSGKAEALEMQIDLRWVDVNRLQDFDFPEANQQIIELIGRCCINKIYL